MKTKEFIFKTERLGFDVKSWTSEDSNNKIISIFILHTLRVVANVSENKEFIFDTNKYSFNLLTREKQKKLFDLLIEYASTPIDYREDEEREYFLKLVYIKNAFQYLNEFDDGYIFSSKDPAKNIKTIFPESKIEKLPAWIHTMIDQGLIVKENAK